MTRRWASARGTVLTLVALAALACGGDSGTARDSDTGVAFRPLGIGAGVPVIAVRTLAGDTVRIAPGQPATLLNVWATWCTSCREEMDDLNALEREFAPRGLRVVGVSVDLGDGTRVRRYAESAKLAFTVAHDPDDAVQRSYQVLGVPETFLISGDGRLLWRQVGGLRPVMAEARQAIEKALAR